MSPQGSRGNDVVRQLILPFVVAASLLVGCTSGVGRDTPSPHASAATASPVAASQTGAGGSVAPVPDDQRLFVRPIEGSAGMTVAVDATGVIHVAAAAALAQGDYSVVYGRCADQCDQPSSWQIVPLAPGAGVSHVPTIALTEDARPRIVYEADLTASPGYSYLECDSACDQVAGWYSVQLTTEHPTPKPAPRPRMPFAIAADGAAAFAYDDGFGMYVWICESRCAAGTSWKRVTVADVYVYPEAVAFGSRLSLQVIARHAVQDTETLAWFDCPSDCTSGENWAGLDQLWTTRGVQTMDLAPTATGGTRILTYGDASNTNGDERVFGFLSCDTDCRNAASWNPQVAPPLAPGSANVGFALALDGSGETVVATVSEVASTVARCTQDCAGLTGKWQLMPGVGVADLNASIPPTVPDGCLSASWGMHAGPALAFDPHGPPVVAISASAVGLGGACGPDTPATTTDSFLFSSP